MEAVNGGLRVAKYPLVNVYITMERSTIFHGKIHYFYSQKFHGKVLMASISSGCNAQERLEGSFQSSLSSQLTMEEKVIPIVLGIPYIGCVHMSKYMYHIVH